MAKRSFEEKLRDFKVWKIKEVAKENLKEYNYWEVNRVLKGCTDEELKALGYFRCENGIFKKPPERRLRSDKAREKIYARIDEKHKEMEELINSEYGEKWKEFYEKCKEPADDKDIMRELKEKGIIKEKNKPLRVSFFLKDGSDIRTIHFAGERFYSKMGMLYHFNINKKDYFPARSFGLLPTWFKCKSRRSSCVKKGNKRWINVWSEKQILYLLEIMDDMKLLVGCKPHHYWEHDFDIHVQRYLKQMEENWKVMGRDYARKYGLAKFIKNEETGKKEFTMVNDVDIIYY